MTTTQPSADAPSAPTLRAPSFVPVPRCWVCEGQSFERFHLAKFEHEVFEKSDPELRAYTGSTVWMQRCRACDFTQPQALPALPNYFDRMYAIEWTEASLEAQFASAQKDLIFDTVLDELASRLPAGRRRLLDVGTHVGRFLRRASDAGWEVEGIELNPRTSAFAAQKTGLPIHRKYLRDLAAEGKRYDAVTFSDVLEHIPDPLVALREAATVLDEGGVIAIKVPNGRQQLRKEHVRARVTANYTAAVARNLIHVNQFSPKSLTAALTHAGFRVETLTIGAPEHVPRALFKSVVDVASTAVRLGVYFGAKAVPGAIHTPLALNLQAYARRV